jgi:hypothetical protein
MITMIIIIVIIGHDCRRGTVWAHQWEEEWGKKRVLGGE